METLHWLNKSGNKPHPPKITTNERFSKWRTTDPKYAELEEYTTQVLQTSGHKKVK